MDPYLQGSRLWGDDFTPDQITQWFAEEQQAYFSLGPGRRVGDYGYHALNILHGFRHLPEGTFPRALGVGSGFGDEFDPIAHRCTAITILEPAQGFHNPRFTYVEPRPSGEMPFADESFDLVLCLSALHHIANVSAVVHELARVLRVGGCAIIREPIVSLGDWRGPRPGLTKNERGIPVDILNRVLGHCGLTVIHRSFCAFPFTRRIRNGFNSAWITALDAYVCSLPWPIRYHVEKPWHKLQPNAACFVVRRGSAR